MSAYVSIVCDVAERPEHGGTCMSEDSPPGPAARTATSARNRLRRAGWRRTRDGRDICPDCWKDGRR